jgi:F-type H+-transporting ATPase subunit a
MMMSTTWLMWLSSGEAMAAEGGGGPGYHFSWVQLIPGYHSLVESFPNEDAAIAVLSSWAICILLIAAALVARKGLNKARARGGTLQYVPDAKFSFFSIAELYTKGIYGMCLGALTPKDTRKYFWLLGGLFIYIFCSNLLAVTPGGLPPTAVMSTNAALALVVFLVFNVEGIRRNGLGYFKHMAGPVWYLAWLIFPIELVGLLVRPASLSLRLAGNMTGDHMVFGIMSDLTTVLIPAIFLGLGIFVSFLQAFVFTLLSAIYISLSVADHGHEAH